MSLKFIVAVRHQDTVTEWARVRAAIEQTAKSIAAQVSPEWSGVFVANEGADMPRLPPGLEVVRVSFDPPVLPSGGDRSEYYEAIRRDKGRRILAGLESIDLSGHVMVVDYDDFVSNRLASHVAGHPADPGWFVNSGYLAEWPGRLALSKPNGFNEVCGSSLIVRADLYSDLFALSGSAREALAARWLGSHRFIRSDLAERGVELRPLPFPGAVWRLAGPGETSGARAVRSELTANTRNPLRMAYRARALRVVSKKLKREFFGDR